MSKDVIDMKSRPHKKKRPLPAWREDAEFVAQNNKASLLAFGFSCIENKQVLMDVLVTAEKLLRKYPEEHSNFIDGIYSSRKAAEDGIRRKQERAAAQPAEVIRFPSVN